MSTRTWAFLGTSGSWSTITNWSPIGVPATGDDVVIPPPAGTTSGTGVTLDVSTTPPLDSVTVGGTAGFAFLSIGANKLDVTGTGAGATGTVQFSGYGPISSIAGGTIAARSLLFSYSSFEGFGTLAISGAIAGHGEITADGLRPRGQPAIGGTLSITGTIEAGVRLSILPAVANNTALSALEILGTAVSSYAIPVNDRYQKLMVGPSGSVTINAPQSVGSTVVLEGPDSKLLLGSNSLTIGDVGTLSGRGIVSAATLTGKGTLAAVGGTLELAQSVPSSTGLTFSIGTGALLQLDGTVGSGNTFSFPGAGQASLGLGNDAGFSGTLSNMYVGSGTSPTNFVDIQGHQISVLSATGQGSSSGTVALTDHSVLHLANLTSPNWNVRTADDGSGGTDVFLTTARPPGTPHDLNGQGKADVVLQNSDSGQTWLWVMNGSTPIGSGMIATPDPGWQVKGTGDLNGDGLADIVLQKSDTGQAWVWLMNGTAIIGGGNIATPQAGWQIKGIADSNGDARADIVMQNQNSGQVWIWEMNGNTIAGGGAVGTPQNGWQVVATGDLNGDGKADIVMQNQNSSQVWLWEMDGNRILHSSSLGTPQAGWRIVTTGDFNSDGMADLVWQNANTGQVGISEMNGSTAFGWADIGTPDSLNWHVKQAGDFVGNGGTDILLQNSSTLQSWEWILNGTTLVGGGHAGTPQAGWHIPVING
jgi:hypothetical protein